MIEDIGHRIEAGEDVPDSLSKTMLLAKDENLDDLDKTIMASAFMIGGVETVESLDLPKKGKLQNGAASM